MAACALAPAGASAATASTHAPAAPVPAAAQGHPYRHGVVPPRGGAGALTPALSSGTANLRYGGAISGVGVVTGSPQVYLVFWGSQWGTQGMNAQGNVTLTGDPSGMAPYVESFFKGIGTGGETWSGVMTQYCQGVATGATSCPSSAQHVGYPSGGAFAGVWVDESTVAPSQASGHQIGLEAVRAATHFGNTTQSSNLPVQYVIVSPHGTHPDGYNTASGNFCAWHDYTGDAYLSGGAVSSSDGLLAFTNLPYLTDMGSSCGSNFVNAGSAGALDGVSIVEGHEYAETVTDEYPAGGWTDSSGYENGDKCAWISSGQGASQNISLTTGTFAVQSTWANDGATCEVTHPIIGGGSANTVTVTNPGSQQSTAGRAIAPLTITATDSGGATLSYSATGLPAGLSIGSSSGTISGTPTTGGTYTTKVTATDSTGATGSTTFTWTVSAGSGCTAAQLLGNAGFETGKASPWAASAGVIRASTSSEPSHSGGYFAGFDGYGTTHTDTLTQAVTLPAGCTTYALSFWLHIDTAETTTTVKNDVLSVRVLNSAGTLLATLATYSNLDAAPGYTQHTVSLAAYAGQTVTLKFAGHENATLQTTFALDDTALNVS